MATALLLAGTDSRRNPPSPKTRASGSAQRLGVQIKSSLHATRSLAFSSGSCCRRARAKPRLLGWILFEADDLDGAERRFKQAANDRVPKVRESATRGITAIDRTRGR